MGLRFKFCPLKKTHMKTAAIVFTEKNRAALQTISMPDPRPNEVQVRTLYSTISNGTEGWILQNLFTWQATMYPCVPGYQRVGVITKLGKDVTGWKEGDKVFASVGSWQADVPPQWGSHMAVGNTVATELYRLPAGATDIAASAALVAQVGYNAAFRPSFAPGDWVVVYGDGIIGQCAAQAARARQGRVIVVGHRPERLAVALKASADFVINNHGEAVAESVLKLTGQKSVAVVIDTIQSEAAQQEYEQLLEHGSGQVVYAGFTPGKAWADMGALQMRELTTHFISGWNRTRVEKTLELIAQGKMNPQALITHLVSYERGPEMYEMILTRKEPFTGITLNWEKAA